MERTYSVICTYNTVEVSGLPCTVKRKAGKREGAHLHEACIFVFFYIENRLLITFLL
jgi:hypothetical protein